MATVGERARGGSGVSGVEWQIVRALRSVAELKEFRAHAWPWQDCVRSDSTPERVLYEACTKHVAIRVRRAVSDGPPEPLSGVLREGNLRRYVGSEGTAPLLLESAEGWPSFDRLPDGRVGGPSGLVQPRYLVTVAQAIDDIMEYAAPLTLHRCKVRPGETPVSVLVLQASAPRLTVTAWIMPIRAAKEGPA